MDPIQSQALQNRRANQDQRSENHLIRMFHRAAQENSSVPLEGATSCSKNGFAKRVEKNRPEDPTAATERLRLLAQFMEKNPLDIEAKLEYCEQLIQVQTARRQFGVYNEENFPVEKLISILKSILRLSPDDVESKRYLSFQFRHREVIMFRQGSTLTMLF